MLKINNIFKLKAWDQNVWYNLGSGPNVLLGKLSCNIKKSKRIQSDFGPQVSSADLMYVYSAPGMMSFV